MTMNKKVEAGHRVVARLFPAEDALDTAIIDNAALVIAMVKACRESRQPIGVIQSALTDAMDVCNTLVEARKSMVSTHLKLNKVREKLDMREINFGCEFKCPEMQFPDFGNEFPCSDPAVAEGRPLVAVA